MKNLTKIFMAVVAGMFAFSCVTDTTTEPTVELGKVKTTIDLSFEGVKTHLGDKNGTQYPLLWSTGDQIAVNGIVSEPLADEFDGKAGASFEIESETELTYPRSIIYPAPAEGETGVTFQAVQAYKAGNIADGVAPLYGYAAEAGDVITLQHLTGVLRFAVKGEATLASMTVKAEGGAIAGSFDVDFATGALTAQDGKTSSEISMSFGEGLALSTEEATPIYIAVPAGDYGILVVTLHTATDKMTARIDTSAKPITAGKVREFNAIEYAANDVEGEEYLIETKEDLIEFATIAANFTPYKVAKLAGQIDMTGEAWTPIEGFACTFDGGNENATAEGEDGYWIKGLTAPLFASTTATIQNVKLLDVAITQEAYSGSKGALVTVLAGGSVTNCSVSGTVTMSDPTADLGVGGMIGIVTGESTLSSLVNRCAVTVTVSNNVNANVGGVLGNANNTLAINGCHNYGSVSVSGTNTARVNAGGIVGLVSKKTTALNCTNSGAITATNDATNSGDENNIGGIIGRIVAGSCSVTSCSNNESGIVTVSGKTSTTTALSGIVGYAGNMLTIDGCENHGKVQLLTAVTGQIFIGGVLAYDNATGSEIKNSSNAGEIYAASDVSSTNHIRSGGITGYSLSSAKFLQLTNSGKVNIESTTKSAYVGGIVGFAGSATSETLINSGHISFAGKATTESVRIGGCLAGPSGGSHTNLTNDTTGKIIVTGEYAGTAAKGGIYAGGVVGVTTSTATYNTLTNNGTMELAGKSTNSNYVAGGVLGYASGTTTCENLTNKGTATFGGVAATTYCSGGVVGYTKIGSFRSLTNESTGVITIEGTAVDHKVGGVIGYIEGTTCESLINKGVLTCGGTASATYYSGGVVGYLGNGTHTSLTNESTGTITIDGIAVDHKAGGVVGYIDGSTCETLTNKATATFGGTATTTYYSGGVVGYLAGGTPTSLTNDSTGAITITGAAKNHNAGGVVGHVAGMDISSFTNSAPMTFSGKASMASSVADELTANKQATNHTTTCVGGVVGAFVGASAETYNTATNLTNSGVLTLTGWLDSANASQVKLAYFNVGGVVGYATYCNLTNCDNTASQLVQTDTAVVNVSGVSGSNKHGLQLGGILGNGHFIGTIDGCDNSATLSLNAPNGNSTRGIIHYVGGIAGNVGYDDYAPSYVGKICNSKNSGALECGETLGTRRFRLGGIAGAFYGTELNNCTNEGAISYPGSKTTNQFYLGGLIGVTTTAKVDGCFNSGAITLGKNITSSTGTATYIGGAIGYLAAGSTATDTMKVGCLNTTSTGSITVAGDCGLTDAALMVGGLVGNIKETYAIGYFAKDCKVYADIKILNETNTKIAMITGSARATNKIALNCEVGGRIARTESEKKTWDDDAEDYIVGVTPDWIELDGTNYFSYIYGGKTDWSGVTPAYDGCSWLSEKPTVSAQ